MSDQPSLTIINNLHPKVRPHAVAGLADAEAALTGRAHVRLTSGYRTYAEQDALYKLGRTVRNPDGVSANRPMGQIVTNAKGGQSNHNFAIAIDFALIVDSDHNGTYDQTSWDTNKDYDGDLISDWTEVVNAFKKHGFLWGGDWHSFKDMPHLEFPTGLSLTQMDLRYKANNVIAGTHYINF